MSSEETHASRVIHGRNVRLVGIAIILCGIVGLLALFSLMLGNRVYSLSVITKVLAGQSVQGATFAIRTLRLPRMLVGLLVGMSFGMAGSSFQTLLRNPLASPDIIGITAGSSVAAVFFILVLHLDGIAASSAAVFSGLGISLVIYWLSGGGQFSGGRLILIGIGVQAMLSSAIGYMLLQANQYDVPAAMRWLTGSLASAQMEDIPRLFIVTLVFGVLLNLLGRHLRLLELGEEAATSLGLKTDMTRLLITIASVFLVAFATSTTGPIAFVAFLSGPIARKLAGSARPSIAALVGAVLVLASDLIGQHALPVRLPVGVITGILGAPYLIILLIQTNRAGASA